MSGNAEVVSMSLENDHCEEEVLGEGASEGEPFDSMTNNEEEVAAIDTCQCHDQGSRGERLSRWIRWI